MHVQQVLYSVNGDHAAASALEFSMYIFGKGMQKKLVWLSESSRAPNLEPSIKFAWP